MGKTIKVLSLLILIIILSLLTLSVKLQIEYEAYINFQKEEYGLLKDKKRLKYTPVILYLFELKVLKTENIDTDAYNIIVYRAGIHEIGITMQKYMIHCYFYDEEKRKFIENVSEGS
jgi:hypothetical protein